MKKILVSIDERLLDKVDRAAKRSGESRSAYVSEVLQREVGSASGPGRDPRVREALRRITELVAKNAQPDKEDSTDFVRRMRDERTKHLMERDG